MSTHYTHLTDTADLRDCTRSGWRIAVSDRRLRYTRHCRWQGSRDGAVYVHERAAESPVTEAQALDLAAELDELIGCREIGLVRGTRYRRWTCIDAGVIVR